VLRKQLNKYWHGSLNNKRNQNKDKKELAEAWNDFVRINNERITGYEKAADQNKTSDSELQFFLKMAQDSRTYVKELNEKIIPLEVRRPKILP